MKINLIKECEKSEKKEFYYGALINKNIEDVYLGWASLNPKERKEKFGPPKGHEEIILLLNGEMMLSLQDEDVLMKKGDSIHLPNGHLVTVENLTDKKIDIIVAGGHVVHHEHDF